MLGGRRVSEGKVGRYAGCRQLGNNRGEPVWQFVEAGKNTFLKGAG